MGLLAGSSEDSWNPSITSNTTARSYWFNWRVLLCGMWIAISISLASLLIRKYEPFCSKRTRRDAEHREPETLYDDETWSPCLNGIHPAWLLGFRALAFCLLLAMLIATVLVDGPSIYYYYTQWTSTSINLYFGLGLLLSVRGCIKHHNAAGGERVGNVDIDSEQGISAASMPAETSINSSTSSSKAPDLRVDHPRQTSGFLGLAFQILFQINAGAVVLTDGVFWLIIFPFLMVKHYRLSLLDISMHTINVALLLIDAALNCLRFPLFRIAYFFLWTVFFVIFQWILHACVPIWWPYPFLDLSSRHAPIWYLSVALMHLPCYGVFALMMKLKHFLLARWFPRSNRVTGQAPMQSS